MNQKEIIVESYNDDWRIHFDELKAIFSSQLKDLVLMIEHVGSTSVPGLASKPILDIDIVIDSMGLLPNIIEELHRLGYYHEGDLGVEGREAFARSDSYVPYTKEKIQKMQHHLYVCEKNSIVLKNHIKFRNTLRKHSDLVDKYGRLKNELAQKFKHNRQAYTNGKTTFVTSVLNKYQ
jgi:GrpB-like predicted nucleotidyltransferase (UPF0157 family)